MTDFKQLHKLANELEEFSSKTLNQSSAIKPKPITSGAILSSVQDSQLATFNINSNLNTAITKKKWPTNPSLEFFSSQEVLAAEKQEVKQSESLDLQVSSNNFNAHNLLNSMGSISPVLEKKKVLEVASNNLDYKNLAGTLDGIGFVSIQDIVESHSLNKKKLKPNTASTELNKKIYLGVKSQAFTCLHKELGFSLFSFCLDFMLNFSIFIVFNTAYKLLFSISLFQMSTLKFFFVFSLIFQLSNFIQRVLFKQSFGEWYTNVQIGTNRQQNNFLFSLSLFWRSFVTLITGVMFLPLVSFFLNKDISYYLTDLQTFKKK